MKVSKIKNWVSVISYFGVFLGLILVAYELQQNSALMQVQITQARADAAMLSNEQLFNSEFIPPILAKADTGQDLSDEEWIRYVAWFRAWNRNQENVLRQYHAGMLDDNVPRSVDAFVRDIVMRNTHSREAWKLTKVGYTDEYVEFAEAIISEAGEP